MVDAEAPWIRLAGSGPCLFTMLRADESGRARARAVADRLRGQGLEVFVAETLDEPPLPTVASVEP
jgi:hypothetical protein